MIGTAMDRLRRRSTAGIGMRRWAETARRSRKRRPRPQGSPSGWGLDEVVDYLRDPDQVAYYGMMNVLPATPTKWSLEGADATRPTAICTMAWRAGTTVHRRRRWCRLM